MSLEAIEAERVRRQAIWDALIAQGDPRSATPQLVSDLGLRPLKTGQGVFRDLGRASHLAPRVGVTLSYLDTGQAYARIRCAERDVTLDQVVQVVSESQFKTLQVNGRMKLSRIVLGAARRWCVHVIVETIATGKWIVVTVLRSGRGYGRPKRKKKRHRHRRWERDDTFDDQNS